MENPNPDQTTEETKEQDTIELLSPIVWDGDIIPQLMKEFLTNKLFI